MKNWLSDVDKDIAEVIQLIGRETDVQGVAAFLVGGFVRDIILKRKNLDLDIVMETDAIRFAQLLSSKLNASLVMHKQFGTATLILSNNLRVDLTTARKENYSHPGALPTVEEGALRDDLFRRDFTINAIALSINQERFGQLRDDFEGTQDIKKKIIRVLHERSFLDDPTRILRAVRFEQRFGFRIEPKTLNWLKAALRKNAVATVKSERYFAEFRKILMEQQPHKSIERLRKLNGLGFLGKGLRIDAAVIRLLMRLNKEVAWMRQKLPYSNRLDNWLIYFMGLTYHATPSQIQRMGVQFNFKKADRQKLLENKGALSAAKKLSAGKLAPSRIYQLLKPWSYETILFLRGQFSAKIIRKRIEDYLLKYDTVRLELGGSDLAAIGMQSGPHMGKLLEYLLYQKIDGNIRSREDELRLARQWISKQ